ncbi:MAG: dihydroxyacetone kinase subunit DhaL [Chloroflexota bacterium]|nr:dihydroxyacetone kinase subunit DhaL [Chloroflexota bacterium]
MFDLSRFKALFYLLYQTFNDHRARLNQLDAVVGDGDHGDTMARGFRAAARAAEDSDEDIAGLFTDVANALAEETGGAIGPLLAAFFGEGAFVFEGKQQIGLTDLAVFFRSGYEAVQVVGGAHPGDKTLLDALGPAVDALEAESGLSLQAAFGRATEAAEVGVVATREMQAEEGRARFLGERSKGHPDPGAASFALIVKSFTEIAEGRTMAAPDLAGDVEADSFHPSGKFINSPASMIAEDNLGLALAYPGLVRLTDEGVLVRAKPKSEGKVGLAIGQGGGHTPSMGGFVGPGLLDADVYGPLFTCASGLKIAEAIKQADHGAGVALLVSNHAGDVLNARLGKHRAEGAGQDVELILLSDDVATAPREDYLRRRGLGGLLFALKVGGGAAEAGLPLTDVAKQMRAVNERTASLAVASRAPRHPFSGERLFDLPEGQIEVGTGVHGEVGVYRGDLLPPDELVELLLDQLVTDLDAFLEGRVWVFLNGSGGTSQTELHILYQSIYRQLGERGLQVMDGVVGSYFTTLEMGGFSLSLCALPEAALPWWAAPASSPACRWPLV